MLRSENVRFQAKIMHMHVFNNFYSLQVCEIAVFASVFTREAKVRGTLGTVFTRNNEALTIQSFDASSQHLLALIM